MARFFIFMVRLYINIITCCIGLMCIASGMLSQESDDCLQAKLGKKCASLVLRVELPRSSNSVLEIIATSLDCLYVNRSCVISCTNIHTYTYHSRFIPEGVAEVSQIFLRDTHVLPKLVSYDEQCRRDRW
jgi:hypothetical protein